MKPASQNAWRDPRQLFREPLDLFAPRSPKQGGESLGSRVRHAQWWRCTT
jgi:hypothetical protein